MPGPAPSEQTSSGCRNPRNTISSHTGASVVPITAIITTDVGSESSAFIGLSMSGVRINTLATITANATSTPQAATNGVLNSAVTQRVRINTLATITANATSTPQAATNGVLNSAVTQRSDSQNGRP